LLEAHGIENSDVSWHPKSAEFLKTLVSHTDDVLAMTTLNDGTSS